MHTCIHRKKGDYVDKGRNIYTEEVVDEESVAGRPLGVTLGGAEDPAIFVTYVEGTGVGEREKAGEEEEEEERCGGLHDDGIVR